MTSPKVAIGILRWKAGFAAFRWRFQASLLDPKMLGALVTSKSFDVIMRSLADGFTFFIHYTIPLTLLKIIRFFGNVLISFKNGFSSS